MEIGYSGGKKSSDKKRQPKEKVLLDMNPAHFDKAQDNLFFDFFSIYAKNFVGEEKKSR